MGNCIPRVNSNSDLSSLSDDDDDLFPEPTFQQRPNFAAFHSRMDQLIRNLRNRQQRRNGYEEI